MREHWCVPALLRSAGAHCSLAMVANYGFARNDAPVAAGSRCYYSDPATAQPQCRWYLRKDLTRTARKVPFGCDLMSIWRTDPTGQLTSAPADLDWRTPARVRRKNDMSQWLVLPVMLVPSPCRRPRLLAGGCQLLLRLQDSLTNVPLDRLHTIKSASQDNHFCP